MEVLANMMLVIILQYISQINTLYTLKSHSVICQVYLNKVGDKKQGGV